MKGRTLEMNQNTFRPLFRQNIYRDKWLLLIGIPITTILIQHIGVDWETTSAWIGSNEYWETISYNFFGLVLIFLANKTLILYLDKRLPYRPHFKRRISYQLFLSLCLTIAIGELHSYLYIVTQKVEWDSQYTTDLPFAIVLTILFNVIYIIYYLQYESNLSKNSEDPQIAMPTQTVVEQLEVSIGNKRLFLDITEVALIFSQDRITHILTASGKKYIVNQNLKQLSKNLNPVHFFQANRQVIISKDIVQGYHRHPSRKLELILAPKDFYNKPIYVSKEKTPHFLEWRSA